jgi:hypothetical protein
MMGWILECLDYDRQIQLVGKTDLSFQCIALNLYVHISNSSLRRNLLGNKYDSTVCSTLLLCSVTFKCYFRFHYSVRAVKDGEEKEGKFIKRYICMFMYVCPYIYVCVCVCVCVCVYIYIYIFCNRSKLFEFLNKRKKFEGLFT